MPAGRPTKYTPEMPDMVRAYAWGGYKEQGSPLPTYEGLSKVLQVTVCTIKTWAKEEGKEEFSSSLKELLDAQRQNLVERGLVGDYNATIAKLMLSANHGVIERTAKEITGGDGGPVQVTAVELVPLESKD